MSWQHISGPIVLALAVGVAAQEVRHLGASGGDRLLECARGLFGRAVFRGQFAHFPETLACSGDKSALTESLRSAGYRVVESADAVLLLPENTFQPRLNVGPTQRRTWTMTWKTFRVEDAVVNWREAEGNHSLNREDLNAIAAEVFRLARPVPQYVPYHAKSGDTVTLHRHLTIDLHATGKRSPSPS